MDETFKAYVEEFLQIKEYIKLKEEFLKNAKKLNAQIKKDSVNEETKSSSQPDLFSGYRTIVSESDNTEKTEEKRHFKQIPLQNRDSISRGIVYLWQKYGIIRPGVVKIPLLDSKEYDDDPLLRDLKKLNSSEHLRNRIVAYLCFGGNSTKRAYRNKLVDPKGFLYPFRLVITGTSVSDYIYLNLDYL